ncbi:MAG: hypothetical protein WA192_15975 [Candidatus Acidiferrales bacterium]
MRAILNSFLISILAVGLINVPSFAANEKPLGLITQAQEAHLGTANVAIGTTVYPGDTLATDEGGTVRLKVGGSQFYLLASSAATLSQDSNAVNASVVHGTVGFSSNGTDQLALEIPEGIVRAANGQPGYGQVTILGPREVIVSAYRGTLVLDNDGEMHEIPAGKSYRVSMDLDAAAEPQGPAGAGGTQNNKIVTPRRRHLVFDMIMMSAVGAVSYALWYHLSESPSSPANRVTE